MARNKIKNDTDQRPFSMIYHDFFKSNLLNTHEKMIFIALKIFTDNNNQCFPSLKKISDITGISKRKIQDSLKEMERKQIISIENRFGTYGGKSSNLYTLHDFKELWNASNSEDIAAVANEISEMKLVSELRSRGYTVTKEKELDAEPTKAQSQAPKLNQFDIVNNTTDSGENQDLERYTITQIKQLFDYDIMLQEQPDLRQDIDTVMSILHTAMNTAKSTIHITGQDKPTMVVISKLMKLDKNSILYAIEKYQEQTEKIKNPTAYMLTILYNAPEQYHLDIKNQISNEKAKVDHGPEEKNNPDKEQSNKSNFHNFTQRIYDYETLEANLLKNQDNQEDDQKDFEELLKNFRK